MDVGEFLLSTFGTDPRSSNNTYGNLAPQESNDPLLCWLPMQQTVRALLSDSALPVPSVVLLVVVWILLAPPLRFFLHVTSPSSPTGASLNLTDDPRRSLTTLNFICTSYPRSNPNRCAKRSA